MPPLGDSRFTAARTHLGCLPGLLSPAGQCIAVVSCPGYRKIQGGCGAGCQDTPDTGIAGVSVAPHPRSVQVRRRGKGCPRTFPVWGRRPRAASRWNGCFSGIPATSRSAPEPTDRDRECSDTAGIPAPRGCPCQVGGDRTRDFLTPSETPYLWATTCESAGDTRSLPYPSVLRTPGPVQWIPCLSCRGAPYPRGRGGTQHRLCSSFGRWESNPHVHRTSGDRGFVSPSYGRMHPIGCASWRGKESNLPRRILLLVCLRPDPIRHHGEGESNPTQLHADDGLEPSTCPRSPWSIPWVGRDFVPSVPCIVTLKQGPEFCGGHPGGGLGCPPGFPPSLGDPWGLGFPQRPGPRARGLPPRAVGKVGSRGVPELPVVTVAQPPGLRGMAVGSVSSFHVPHRCASVFRGAVVPPYTQVRPGRKSGFRSAVRPSAGPVRLTGYAGYGTLRQCPSRTWTPA